MEDAKYPQLHITRLRHRARACIAKSESTRTDLKRNERARNKWPNQDKTLEVPTRTKMDGKSIRLNIPSRTWTTARHTFWKLNKWPRDRPLPPPVRKIESCNKYAGMAAESQPPKLEMPYYQVRAYSCTGALADNSLLYKKEQHGLIINTQTKPCRHNPTITHGTKYSRGRTQLGRKQLSNE